MSYDSIAWGETEGFAMSQLAGILSLFFIAAALLTSWYDGPKTATADILFPTLQVADE